MTRTEIIDAHATTLVGFWQTYRANGNDFAWFWEAVVGQYSLEVARIAARRLGAARVGRNANELRENLALLW